MTGYPLAEKMGQRQSVSPGLRKAHTAALSFHVALPDGPQLARLLEHERRADCSNVAAPPRERETDFSVA